MNQENFAQYAEKDQRKESNTTLSVVMLVEFFSEELSENPMILLITGKVTTDFD